MGGGWRKETAMVSSSNATKRHVFCQDTQGKVWASSFCQEEKNGFLFLFGLFTLRTDWQVNGGCQPLWARPLKTAFVEQITCNFAASWCQNVLSFPIPAAQNPTELPLFILYFLLSVCTGRRGTMRHFYKGLLEDVLLFPVQGSSLAPSAPNDSTAATQTHIYTHVAVHRELGPWRVGVAATKICPLT